MILTTEDLALAQRRAALKRANNVRTMRAALKRALASGLCLPDPYLERPRAWMKTWRIADFLVTLPAWGPIKVRRLLAECQISQDARIGNLTTRQRNAILAAVQERAK
jgi:hypothetical protein